MHVYDSHGNTSNDSYHGWFFFIEKELTEQRAHSSHSSKSSGGLNIIIAVYIRCHGISLFTDKWSGGQCNQIGQLPWHFLVHRRGQCNLICWPSPLLGTTCSLLSMN